MFSDLALIDWIALFFAAVLMAAAAAAGLVAYATARSRPKMPQHAADHLPSARITRTATVAKSPAHARVESTLTLSSSSADTEDRSAPPIVLPASLDAEHAAIDVDSTDTHDNPQPPDVHLSPEDSVAVRAAKLRRRPAPETSRQRKGVVAMVESGVGPGNAMVGSVATEREQSGVSIGMARTTGFSARSPGFFEDPVGRHELRYWDGHRWTEYVKEHGERFTDPL